MILGIETSCDETALALYCPNKGIITHQIYSQTEEHNPYGGIVPELASRAHLEKMPVLLEATLKEANITFSDLTAIGYTRGPGLLGALMIGGTFAKTLAWRLKIPLIPVHHMEGHLLATFITSPMRFPFIALLVSGGHTMIIHAKSAGCYELLGETQDDAAGEAFDKVAQMLGWCYPGGKRVAEAAKQGNPKAFNFPRPMLKQAGCQMSFSGLKTHVRYTINQLQETEPLTDSMRCDIAASFEEAVTQTLVTKVKRACEATDCYRVVIGGGVGANERLRAGLIEMLKPEHGEAIFPSPELCTDNGMMIAFVASLRLQDASSASFLENALPRWPIQTLSPFNV